MTEPKIRSFLEFFKQEKEIYIQNVSKGQVSMQFGRGEDVQAFTLRRKRDPIVLTNQVPFKSIAESLDFRKLINRTPPLVKLLTKEEYVQYYKDRSLEHKIPIDEAIEQGENAHSRAAVEPPKATAPKEELPDDKQDKEGDLVTEQDVIHPRLLHICNQVSPQVPKEEWMKPAELLDKLKDLSDEFRMDDFEYVLAHTPYKTVHVWARGCQKQKSQQQLVK